MIPIVELAYNTVAKRLGAPERRRHNQEEDEDRDRTDRRAHLRTNQQALNTITLFDSFVVNNFMTGNVQISLCSHGFALSCGAGQRVPDLANSATESMFVSSMNDGPVRVA